MGDHNLPPGFRFYPTDEELVAYYLRRKVSCKPFRVDAISEIEVYKTEPWDLPGTLFSLPSLYSDSVGGARLIHYRWVSIFYFGLF